MGDVLGDIPSRARTRARSTSARRPSPISARQEEQRGLRPGELGDGIPTVAHDTTTPPRPRRRPRRPGLAASSYVAITCLDCGLTQFVCSKIIRTAG